MKLVVIVYGAVTNASPRHIQGVLFRADKFVGQVPNERELLQNVKKYFFFFAEIAMQHYKFQACAAAVCFVRVAVFSFHVE